MGSQKLPQSRGRLSLILLGLAVVCLGLALWQRPPAQKWPAEFWWIPVAKADLQNLLRSSALPPQWEEIGHFRLRLHNSSRNNNISPRDLGVNLASKGNLQLEVAVVPIPQDPGWQSVMVQMSLLREREKIWELERTYRQQLGKSP